jgi:hypothetical protein
MYVYVSVVTTMDESMLATHSFDKVPYKAGKKKAQMLSNSAPKYLYLVSAARENILQYEPTYRC